MRSFQATNTSDCQRWRHESSNRQPEKMDAAEMADEEPEGAEKEPEGAAAAVAAVAVRARAVPWDMARS